MTALEKMMKANVDKMLLIEEDLIIKILQLYRLLQ